MRAAGTAGEHTHVVGEPLEELVGKLRRTAARRVRGGALPFRHVLVGKECGGQPDVAERGRGVLLEERGLVGLPAKAAERHAGPRRDQRPDSVGPM